MRRADGRLALYVAPDAQGWIFRRLTHQIASCAGVVIGERVSLVDLPDAAAYRIEADGSLTPLR